MTHGTGETRLPRLFEFVEVVGGESAIGGVDGLSTPADGARDIRQPLDGVRRPRIALKTGADLQVHEEVERLAQGRGEIGVGLCRESHVRARLVSEHGAG